MNFLIPERSSIAHDGYLCISFHAAFSFPILHSLGPLEGSRKKGTMDHATPLPTPSSSSVPGDRFIYLGTIALSEGSQSATPRNIMKAN